MALFGGITVTWEYWPEPILNIQGDPIKGRCEAVSHLDALNIKKELVRKYGRSLSIVDITERVVGKFERKIDDSLRGKKMNEKTCSITVTTTDNKEIVLQCTSSYLDQVRIILEEIRPLMQGDVASNAIRLWKLGNSEKQILPSQNRVDKLLSILQHNVGHGILDIVWDDMIDLNVEYLPVVPKFVYLGENLVVNTDNIKSIILHEEEQKD